MSDGNSLLIMCKESRTSPHSSAARLTRQASGTCADISCISRGAASAGRPSTRPYQHCGSFSGSRSSATISSSTHTSFMSRASSRGAEPRGSDAAARRRTRAQVQGGAERGLWGRAARHRRTHDEQIPSTAHLRADMTTTRRRFAFVPGARHSRCCLQLADTRAAARLIPSARMRCSRSV
jgi:hypothetical protein